MIQFRVKGFLLFTFLAIICLSNPVKGDGIGTAFVPGTLEAVAHEGFENGDTILGARTARTAEDTSGLTPSLDIKGNGLDEVGQLYQSQNLDVTLALDAAAESGNHADWWLAALTPSGWMYFDVLEGSLSWKRSLFVTYQGPLFHLPQTFISRISNLPLGTSTFYFGVDMSVNALVDIPIYYDSLVVNVVSDPSGQDNDLDGYSIVHGDCNDNDNTIFPGAQEVCGDGIDQDCNSSDIACPATTELEGNWKGYEVGQVVSAEMTVHGNLASFSSIYENYSGTFSINSSVTPHQLDFYITSPYTTTSFAIYKIENSQVTIAMSTPGTLVRPTSFIPDYPELRVWVFFRAENCTQEEICNDGIDQDCDGVADELCSPESERWVGRAVSNISSCGEGDIIFEVSGNQASGMLTDGWGETYTVEGTVTSSGIIAGTIFVGGGYAGEISGTLSGSAGSGTWSTVDGCSGTFSLTKTNG